MKKTLCALLISVGVLTSLQAVAKGDVLRLKDDRPQEYVVVKGDTLWDISAKFLATPWKWPELWGMNAQIDNPHLIYPGDIIYLVWVDGKPQLRLKRGVVKLQPGVRVQPLNRAIPSIPLKDVAAFLKDNRIVEDKTYELAPYIVGGKNQRLIAGAGDRVYARGELLDADLKNQSLYRASRSYVDKDTNELLGYELLKVADANVAQVSGDIISLDLTRSRMETRKLDRVLPTEKLPIRSVFYPQAAPDNLNGEILSVVGAVRDGGQFDVVAINKGDRDGLVAGHVFAVYRAGEILKDPVTNEALTLPSELSGYVMVFRTFDKISYALVMESTNVISQGDTLETP
ncbi:MAG: LysM peptidoglycan-binding domain-containing protein [Pontibacterium sp.]